MSFCTAINCIDGRVQLPVNSYMKKKFGVEYVDTVTEPGPNKIIAGRTNRALLKSILDRVTISVEHHGSVGIAVVGHHGCAGNPAEKSVELEQIETSVDYISGKFPALPVVGLWVDENWQVTEVATASR